MCLAQLKGSGRSQQSKCVSAIHCVSHGRTIMPVIIQNKQLFKPKEVADILGEPQHVIRYWTKNFPDIHPEIQDASLVRLYSEDDIKRLMLIKKLLREDVLKIDEAKAQYERLRISGELDTRSNFQYVPDVPITCFKCFKQFVVILPQNRFR